MAALWQLLAVRQELLACLDVSGASGRSFRFKIWVAYLRHVQLLRISHHDANEAGDG